MCTRKLYDETPYETTFNATVLSCMKKEWDEKEAYEVILDQTLFFPEEGGQSPDKGTIQGIEVLDVQIKKDVITHTITAPLEVGATVQGEICWKHRFSNMQQHSGEHIFSGITHSMYGYDNVGFHLSDQIVTMDFSGPLTWEQVMEIESKVNEAIVKNIPVEVTYPSKEELREMDYRSKIEIEGQVRIVTIPGYDVCACCAPHVARTGEIGMLKVMTLQNYKGGVRISMLCGFRALEAFREKASIVSELMGIFSTNQDAIVDNVQKLKGTVQSLKSELGTAGQKLLEYQLKEIPQDQQQVIVFEENMDANVMRNAVNKLTETHPGYCGIFAGNDNDGYRFIVGSTTKDCRELAGIMKEKRGSRGGGGNRMIQGSVERIWDWIVCFFEQL